MQFVQNMLSKQSTPAAGTTLHFLKIFKQDKQQFLTLRCICVWGFLFAQDFFKEVFCLFCQHDTFHLLSLQKIVIFYYLLREEGASLAPFNDQCFPVDTYTQLQLSNNFYRKNTINEVIWYLILYAFYINKYFLCTQYWKLYVCLTHPEREWGLPKYSLTFSVSLAHVLFGVNESAVD